MVVIGWRWWWPTTKSAFEGPQSTALATKSALQDPKSTAPARNHFKAHKVLRLPRNLHFEVNQVLRLPRNLHFKTHQVCTCHEICISRSTEYCTCLEICTSRSTEYCACTSRSTKYCTCTDLLHLSRQVDLVPGPAFRANCAEKLQLEISEAWQSKRRAQREHPDRTQAFTRTLSTPQCGHTVWEKHVQV